MHFHGILNLSLARQIIFSVTLLDDRKDESVSTRLHVNLRGYPTFQGRMILRKIFSSS